MHVMKKKMMFLIFVSDVLLSLADAENLHDAKCPRCLEHRTLFIDIKSIGVS